MSQRAHYDPRKARLPASDTPSQVMDHAMERSMYDELLGGLVSRGAASYHNYLASSSSLGEKLTSPRGGSGSIETIAATVNLAANLPPLFDVGDLLAVGL